MDPSTDPPPAAREKTEPLPSVSDPRPTTAFTLEEAVQDVPPPQVWDEHPEVPGYEVLSVLGRGGMGVVYKGRHLALDRVIALKVVRGGVTADEESLQRFLTESTVIASIQHPNIVQIFDSGRHRGRPYCVLEYIDGGSLADRLHQGPLGAGEAALVVEHVANGVQAVSRRRPFWL
jgi:serine/threonine-protein kinase